MVNARSLRRLFTEWEVVGFVLPTHIVDVCDDVKHMVAAWTAMEYWISMGYNGVSGFSTDIVADKSGSCSRHSCGVS